MDGQQIDDDTKILTNWAKEQHSWLVRDYTTAIEYAEEQRRQAREKAVRSNNWWGKLTGAYYEAAGEAQRETDHIQDLQEALADQDEKLRQEIKYWEQSGEELKDELQAEKSAKSQERPKSTKPEGWIDARFDNEIKPDKNGVPCAYFTVPETNETFGLSEQYLARVRQVTSDFAILLPASQPNPGTTLAEHLENIGRKLPIIEERVKKFTNALIEIQIYKTNRLIPLDTSPISGTLQPSKSAERERTAWVQQQVQEYRQRENAANDSDYNDPAPKF